MEMEREMEREREREPNTPVPPVLHVYDFLTGEAEVGPKVVCLTFWVHFKLTHPLCDR